MSYQFPVLGKSTAVYHQPGDNILVDSGYLQQIQQGESVIYADRELTNSVLIPKLQERLMMAPMRQEYAKEFGKALAKVADQHIARTIAGGALNAVVSYTGMPLGSGVYQSGAAGGNRGDFVGSELIEYAFDAEQFLDDNSVPREDRFLAVRPQEYRAIVSSSAGRNYIDRDYNTSNGELSDSKIERLAGFELIKSVNFPTDAYSATSSRLNSTKYNDYTEDLSGCLMLAWHRNAVGTVKSYDIAVETEYKVEARGDLVVASSAMGHGVLQHVCCYAVFALDGAAD